MSTPTNSDATALLVEVTRLCEELRAERSKLSDALNLHIALAATLRAERDDMTAGLVEAGEEVLLLRAERDKLLAQVKQARHNVDSETAVSADLRAERDKLRAAIEALQPSLEDPGTYTWQELEPLVAALRAALERPAP